MNKSNRGLWLGVLVIIIIAALVWWLVAASQGISWNFGFSAATSTPATTTASASTDSGSGGPSVTTSKDTVKAIIASLPNASQYESLLASSGVASTMGSGGQFTVFVPTNAAFAALPGGTISKMTAAQLKRLVQYSIVNGRAIEPGAQMSGAVQSYSGDPLNFTDLNNIPMVNSSIIISEYKGSNGVVYLINAVLLPPQKTN